MQWVRIQGWLEVQLQGQLGLSEGWVQVQVVKEFVIQNPAAG